MKRRRELFTIAEVVLSMVATAVANWSFVLGFLAVIAVAMFAYADGRYGWSEQ